MFAAAVGSDVQGGLQPIQRIGLKQRVGQFGQVVDVVRQHLAVLVRATGASW